MLKFSILCTILLPLLAQSRNVLIEKVNYTSEATTPLSITTTDGKAMDLTESAVFKTTDFHPTVKPLKATALSESSESSTMESAIQVEV